MSRILDVYLHEIYAGQLIQNISGNLSFRYDPAYIANNLPALSLSLPLRSEIYEAHQVKTFFSGFLPDEIARHHLAKYLGISEKNAFALLEVVGGECAGALALYPKGQVPPKAKNDDVEILDNKRLKEILGLLKRRPLFVGEEGLRLSLAGAQAKIAVGVYQGNIALIRGASPTTHILKPIISDIKDSVHNELFCMRLAGLVGIDVPHTEIRILDDIPYFLVERYDRIQEHDNHTRRLHQEDFCQALGLMPNIKYEREGGPNIAQCVFILRQYSKEPAIDQLNFLKRIIFNYLIGNTDAHGKNFSLLYKGKKPQLAPAYDLLSTAIYPDFSSKMAMKIGGKYEPEEVLMRHWHKLVPDVKIARQNLEKELLTLSKETVEKAGFLKENLNQAGIFSVVFDEIITIIKKRTERIMRQIRLQI
ncbi:MAG: type II toxin-antitoxin system HipA family toxin [Legionellales bacterium]|nr:type II toxin-antitoxin system HipA family toxin [Legionellales bacterium]